MITTKSISEMTFEEYFIQAASYRDFPFATMDPRKFYEQGFIDGWDYLHAKQTNLIGDLYADLDIQRQNNQELGADVAQLTSALRILIEWVLDDFDMDLDVRAARTIAAAWVGRAALLEHGQAELLCNDYEEGEDDD
jgi:hypothetical protein